MVTMLLSGDHPDLAVLRGQYSVATIQSRDRQESWIAVHFKLPDGTPITSLKEFGFADVTFVLEGDAAKGQAFLSIKDGRLDSLEYVYHDWPENPHVVKIDYMGDDHRDMRYVRHIFAKYADMLAGSHLIATGSRGDYQWLTTGHEMIQFLELCPEIVLGKYLAVTSWDGGVLRPNEREISLGWESRGDIGYSPRVASIGNLPLLNRPDEWYIFETPVDLGQRSNAHPMVESPQVNLVGVFANTGFRIHDPYFANWADSFWNQFEWIRPESYIADGGSCLTFITAKRQLFTGARKKVL